MEIALLILATVLTAATPLLLAALGEHVVERAGVLNLGIEGMMIVGASAAFATATMTDSSLIGVLAGVAGGMVLAGLFAFFAIGLATNQVATGLALTIFGVGVAGLLGAPFVGAKRDPIHGASFEGVLRLVLGQDPFVYASLLAAVGVAWGLARTRPGLMLRGIGESHGSAHALGLPVRGARVAAVLFGGAMAGLGGAYLSLVYTPFWSPGMTAGRGWIALAIVVFAAGKVWRVVFGAYLFGAMTVAQLHAQAGSLGVPAQLLSAIPYLATIVALILLSRPGRGASGVAGSLGQAFVPDR